MLGIVCTSSSFDKFTSRVLGVEQKKQINRYSVNGGLKTERKKNDEQKQLKVIKLIAASDTAQTC